MNRVARLTEPYAPLARRLLPIAGLVTLVAIAIQFLLAGVGVFAGEAAGINGWDAHFWFGGAVHALLGLMLALSLVGRFPRSLMALNAVLFLVATGMMALPRAQGSSPELAAFHPLGAFLVAILAYAVWDRSRAAVAADEALEAPPLPTQG
ncbi:MAG: hypothetical protein ICV64_07885 [Thermoleophilia bacterium]|nr:hypothetical protein [Thermoleophilia bacterium]